jgi:hypothetical protein
VIATLDRDQYDAGCIVLLAKHLQTDSHFDSSPLMYRFLFVTKIVSFPCYGPVERTVWACEFRGTHFKQIFENCVPV